ncbi:transposase [Hominenteromicrobium sp.]|uniref:transposase n=1 Tax=Hominenteromicrobium sp. TaxID=3073581 RepID=UPI003A940DB4
MPPTGGQRHAERAGVATRHPCKFGTVAQSVFQHRVGSRSTLSSWKCTASGNPLGPQLMAEIGDVRRFENKRSLVAFADIDPAPSESGNYSLAATRLRNVALRICAKHGSMS